MKRIFSKILAFSFALIIPLTAFLVTTNQKNVNASGFGRFDLYEAFDNDYFEYGSNNGFLAGTNTFIKYTYGIYQNTPLLHIPYLTTNYIIHGNSFRYDYTLDSSTIYSLTLSKFNDYMVMFSPSTTDYFSIEFNNLVLFTETAYGETFNDTQFYNAIDNYFSNFLEFVTDGSANVNLSVDINFAGNTKDSFTYYYYTNNISTNTGSLMNDFGSIFNGLFNAEGEVPSNYLHGLLRSDTMNFVMHDSVVLDYYNGYFIIPKLVFTFDFSNDVVFYIRSRLGNNDMLPKTKYLMSMYQYDFLMNILSYHGFNDYYSGYDIGYDYGYNKGYNDGAGDLTPFDAILDTIESFLNFKVFPNFPIYYFFLIAFGFALFGLLVKYALGG